MNSDRLNTPEPKDNADDREEAPENVPQFISLSSAVEAIQNPKHRTEILIVHHDSDTDTETPHDQHHE